MSVVIYSRLTRILLQPSTAAQYYHLLRRQQLRNYRKPLVVAAPKTLLRLPGAAASLDQLQPGTHFHTVLPDPALQNADGVEKVSQPRCHC